MLDRSAAVALLAVGVALVVASGAGLVGGEPADRERDPEQLVTSMLADEPASVEGEFYEVVRQNDSALDRTVYNVTVRPPSDRQRVEVVRPDQGNLTLVQNETTAWIYDGSENEVLRNDIGDSERGVVVPALEYGYYDDLLEEFTVTYAGTERVAGHEAHVVVFSDPADRRSTASLDLVVGDNQYQLAETTLEEPLVLSEHRLWIATDHDYPIKRQTTLIGQDGDSVTYTSQYDWIDFEPDDDADTFQFDPPEGTETRDPPSVQTEEYGTVEAAQSAVEYAVPDPTVPEGYELQTVRVSRVNGTTRVALRYGNGNERLSVRVWPRFDHDVSGMAVAVGDRQGTLTRERGKSPLYWECDGRTHTVSVDSGTLSVEAQLGVAESIECR